VAPQIEDWRNNNLRKAIIFALPFRGRDECLPLSRYLDVQWVRPQDYKGGAGLIIMPGSLRTISDLDYLRRNGGESALRSHLAQGGVVVGICGGYQMLGQWLFDPFLKQGDSPLVAGLGILPHSTFFGEQMMQTETTATLLVGKGQGGELKGEEHRSGFSWTEECARGLEPLLSIKQRKALAPLPTPGPLIPGGELLDGVVTADRKVWGTYVHLILHNPAFVHSLLSVL
jgi:adenosylcobyric acid synthase